MLPLFSDMEAISACRDRRTLGQLLAEAVSHLLGSGAAVALYRRERDELAQIALRDPAADRRNEEIWLDMLAGDPLPINLCSRGREGQTYAVLPLQASEIGSAKNILAFSVDESRASAVLEDLLCLVRIYGNHIRLLDYSELDSLTRLLNRKTFDETFDRLLQAAQPHATVSDRRGRGHHAEGAAWLGVIDIDHFKRINDNFGHLFGDEVLLRVADLMRKTFRSEDRLFRFGGEEFVVILNADDEEQAARGFDRFRCAVEEYEFPQIGQVTCSIGVTGVVASDVPTDVVGRADEALYFAKEHGRNQVACYEMLLAQGEIALPNPETPEIGFDIDSLFE